MNQLAPSRWEHWGNSVPNNRLDYPIHARILGFQSAVLRSLSNSDRITKALNAQLISK